MKVVDWLLDSDPSVRWQVMRDLADAPAKEVAAERARIAHQIHCGRRKCMGVLTPGSGRLLRHDSALSAPRPSSDDVTARNDW